MDAQSQQVEGSWKQFKGKLREAWGVLSENDLDRYEGKMDQLVGHVEEKTGSAKQSLSERIRRMADDVKYRY
jgi:uncharacterized protein YjbJ (UPF0337 family)